MAGHTTVRVHHSYEPQREDELKLDKGDIVIVTDSSDPDWWMGKKDDGSSGYFPSNFVEPVVSSPEESKGDADNETDKKQKDSTAEPASETEAEAAPVKPIGMARVMEDYAMQGPDELTLHRGGIATLYERYEDGWFKGEINGKVGRFPGECVEEIDMPGRPDLGTQSADIPKAAENSEDGGASVEPSKPAFKLAAYGVKQGGIGSVLAGGFPALKKTGGAPKKPAEPELKPASPEKPAEPATPPKKEEQQPAKQEPATTKAEPEKPLPVDKFDQEEQPSAPTTEKFAAKAIVLHPYDAENEDELNLLRGEYVNVIDKNIDDGWWKGTTERGQTGVFPSNFVKEIEEESIASPPPVRSRKSLASTGSQQSFSTAASSRVSSGISARAPPLPGNRPTSSGSRPGSLHEQSTPTTEVPSPSQPSIPEETTPPLPAAAEPPSPPAPAEEPEPVPEKEVKEDSAAKDEEAANVDKEEDEKKEATPPVASPPVPSRPPMPASRPSSEASEKTPQPASRPSSEASEKPPKPTSRPSSEASEKPPKPASRPSSEASEKPPKPASRPTSHAESESSEPPAAAPASPGEDVKKDEGSTPPAAEEEKQSKEEPVKKEEQEEVPSASDDTEEVKSPEEEEKKGLDMQPTGPKLSGPARARPTRARRTPGTPEARKEEPSQMDMLKQDLAKEAEEPAKETAKEAEEEAPAAAAAAARSPPAKPVKPIFAKFPTPFGGAAPELKNLKPVQRRMWEPAPAHESTSPEKKEDEDQAAARPTGVRNIASRFNVPSSGNEVLETKLRNFTKNEVDKLRKELQDEREKRVQLEQLVASLAEQVEKLQQQQ